MGLNDPRIAAAQAKLAEEVDGENSLGVSGMRSSCWNTPLSAIGLAAILLVAVLLMTGIVAAAEADGIAAGSPATVRFQADRDLPNCSSALVRGNPANGPSTWLVRSDGDCVVPMHWHSQGEIVIVVSGTAEIEVPNHKPVTLGAGGYYFQPPHQVAGGRFPKGTIGFHPIRRSD
jgi:hypothetical protein